VSVKIIETGIPGLIIIEPTVHGDARGFFMETWNATRYEAAGLPGRFVQSNLSRSGPGVIRGLHYQYPKPQGKLVSVLEGRVFDVAVDIRPDSPSFKQWAGVELSAENHRQHLCTEVYRSEHDAVVAWDDPEIGIHWPLETGRFSQKDAAAPRLKDISIEALPRIAR